MICEHGFSHDGNHTCDDCCVKEKIRAAENTLVKKVETEGGSHYLIDEEYGWWRKNSDSWERLWWSYCVPVEVDSFLAARDHEKLPLSVGFRMYIGSRDLWWLSSPIVKITEVEREKRK